VQKHFQEDHENFSPFGFPTSNRCATHRPHTRRPSQSAAPLFQPEENDMTQSKSSGTQNKQSGAPATEADTASSKGKSSDKSSKDAKSRIKAGSNEGAGGGAKQKQKH
jgi:hypothetical protein